MRIARCARGTGRRRGPGRDSPDAARQRAMADIERATTPGASWSEAKRLLAEFEAGYPGDPATAVLADQLGRGARPSQGEQLAELEAAREVNDPERVLEIYRALGPALDPEPRGCSSATWASGS